MSEAANEPNPKNDTLPPVVVLVVCMHTLHCTALAAGLRLAKQKTDLEGHGDDGLGPANDGRRQHGYQQHGQRHPHASAVALSSSVPPHDWSERGWGLGAGCFGCGWGVREQVIACKGGLPSLTTIKTKPVSDRDLDHRFDRPTGRDACVRRVDRVEPRSRRGAFGTDTHDLCFGPTKWRIASFFHPTHAHHKSKTRMTPRNA